MPELVYTFDWSTFLMKKTLALISVFFLTLNSAGAVSMSGSVSRDYDMSFEAIIKKKFGEIIEMSKVFEKGDDAVYNKNYRPLYMLSMKDFYSLTPMVKSNVDLRKVPGTYNLSLNKTNAIGQKSVSFSDKEKYNNVSTVEVKDKFTSQKAHYQRLMAQNPDRIELMYKYAQFLYANECYDEAIALLKKVIQKDSGFVLASYTLGNIYFDIGDYKSSIKANIVVLRRNPYCADAYFNIASALEQMNKFNLAIDYYQKCLSLNANDKQAKSAIQRLSELTYAK